jgi:hypothetical protein
VDGVSHADIVAFDTATGALIASFDPAVSTTVAAIAATADTVYVGGTFNNVRGVVATMPLRSPCQPVPCGLGTRIRMLLSVL